jgi:hypothetical protein
VGTRRDSDHAHPCRDVLYHHGSGSHNCLISNREPLSNNGSGSNVGMVADSHFAGEYSTGSDVHMVHNLTLVLDCGIRNHNYVCSDDRARIDDGSGEEN